MAEREPIDQYTTFDGQPRCQGRSRQHGRQCRRAAAPGTRFCKNHGSKARKGPAHPNYKHGKTSRYVAPPKLADDYERSLDDPVLTHHRDAIALLDAMIQEVLNGYEEGGGEQSWREVRKSWRRLEKARGVGDRVRMSEALHELGTAIEHGAGRAGKRAEVAGLLEKRRKMADSETKRNLLEGQVYSIETLQSLGAAFGHLAFRYVPDDQKAAFFNEFAAIVRSSEIAQTGDPRGLAGEPAALPAPERGNG